MAEGDFELLKKTLPGYSREALLNSLESTVLLYRELRKGLFNPEVQLQREAEEKVMAYFEEIRRRG